MPAYEQEHGDGAVSSQKKPHSTAACETTAPSYKNPLFAQFRFRVLLVDDEPSIRETAGQILESEGHEGRQAHNRQLTYRGHINVVAVLFG
jgi:PleD family two-component response regulator